MNTEQFISRLVEEGAKKPLPHPMKQTMLWLLGAFAYLGVLAIYTGFRDDIVEQLSSAAVNLELVLLLGMTASAAMAAFCLSRPDSHQKPWIKYLPFGFLVAWALVAFAGSAGDLQLADFRNAMTLQQSVCAQHIVLISIPPGIAMFFILRMGATIRCCWAGSMAAWSVTAVTYMLMRLIEKNDDPAHLIVWHVLPIVLICIAGMMIGRFVLRWR